MKNTVELGQDLRPTGAPRLYFAPYMAHDLVCWRCGERLAELTLPLRRLEECPSCRAELHVCRMCVAYDPRVAKKCREDDAEEVKAKEQANFCDFYRPRPGAFDASLAAAERRAQDELAALFGGSPAGGRPDDAGPAADALFGKNHKDRR